MTEQQVRTGRRGGRRAVRLPAEDGDTLVEGEGGAGRPAATARGGKSDGGARSEGGGRKRADAVREAVLQAALDCYGVFGYDGTSTRAVADRAHVTHTLVLYHFRSKEELWIAALDKALAIYEEAISPILDGNEGMCPGIRLRHFIEQFVRFSARYPQIHRIMTMEGNQDTPRLEWVIDNHLRAHFEKVRDLIRRAQDEGTVRDCDATRLYYFIVGSAGTLFTLSTEYKALTGRDVFSETEILRNLAFLYEIVFIAT